MNIRLQKLRLLSVHKRPRCEAFSSADARAANHRDGVEEPDRCRLDANWRVENQYFCTIHAKTMVFELVLNENEYGGTNADTH